MIKAHKITLTFFVFIYIPPIYIFWKSSPLPQSIVYFISTHTIKSHNKIIPQNPPTTLPKNHSNLTNKSHTSSLAILPITTYTFSLIQYNHPFNHPFYTLTHIYPHIKYNHTITPYKPPLHLSQLIYPLCITQ